MTRRTIPHVLGLLILAAAPVHGENAVAGYSVTTWTLRDGLVVAYSLPITQDQQGYLWLGTARGLLRFDGVQFVHWGPRSPLPETEVEALCVARDGSLWAAFGYSSGITRIRNGHSTIYTAPRDVPAGSRSLIEDHDGTIWAGGAGGVARFRDGRWERIGSQEGLPERGVQSIYEDRRGQLWVGSDTGVFRRNAGQAHFQLVDSSSLYSVFAPSSLSEDSAGSLWVTDSKRALRRLTESDHSLRWIPRGLDATGVRLLHDRRGNMWVATRGQGLLRVQDVESAGAPQVEWFTIRNGLASNNVRSIFEDREGNIWVGTTGGLSRLSESSFVTVIGNARLDDIFATAVTATMDGSLWIVGRDGVRRFSNGTWKRYGQADGLPSEFALALSADEHDILWIATDRGPARFVSGRFSPLSLPPGIHLRQITAMTADRDGGVWLSDVERGLFRWKDGKLSQLETLPHYGPVRTAFTDSRGRVWIGFQAGGIMTYQGARSTSYSTKDGLPGNTVNAIYEDRTGAIWIGTNSGFCRFDDGQFIRTSQPGLAHIQVRSIVEDDQGYLWLGIEAGLVRFLKREFERIVADPSHQFEYRLYNVSDGLLGTITKTGTPRAARSAGGMLWFVSSRGVAVVNPRELRQDRPPPPAHIEAIVADGQEVDPLTHVRLAPLTSRIQIDYTALTLTAPDTIRFRYKLEGFDADWIDAGTRRQAFYTKLPPGNYRFRVTARNAAGWSDPPSMDFSVSPTFYQTRWFYGMCILVTALAVGAAWQLRLARVRTQFGLVLAERARISREIHDTLLQGLIGVALQFDAISKQLDSAPRLAKERLVGIRKEVEAYIRETRQSIVSLRSPTLEIHDLPTALREVGQSLTAGNATSFELLVSGQPRQCAAETEEQILRIGQEAVSNAVRHAHPTAIRMELHFDASLVRLRVSDNGRGFDLRHPEGADKGLGLVSMRERAQQIGGQLTLTSRPDQGTEIEFVAPLLSRI